MKKKRPDPDKSKEHRQIERQRRKRERTVRRTRLQPNEHLIHSRRSTDEQVHIYDDVYGLYRSEMNLDKMEVVHATIIYHTKYSTTAWTTYPSAKVGKKAIQAIVRKNISDCQFTLGCSHRDLFTATFFAQELDRDGVEINEGNYKQFIDLGIQQIFESHRYAPLIMFSGSRSIHQHWLFQTEASVAYQQRLERLAKRLIRNPGDLDKTSLGSGMRFPGFLHQKTGRLSRYLGTNTRDEILDLLESVPRLPVSDEVLSWIERDIDEELMHRSEEDGKYVTNRRGVRIRAVIDDRGRTIVEDKPVKDSKDTVVPREGVSLPFITTRRRDDSVSINMGAHKSTEKQAQNTDIPCTYTSKIRALLDIRRFEPYPYRKPFDPKEKELFESFLKEGIIKGISCFIIFQTRFVFWTFRKYHGDKEGTYKALKEVLPIGIDDPKTVEERIERLESRMSGLDESFAPGQRYGPIPFTKTHEYRIKRLMKKIRAANQRQTDRSIRRMGKIIRCWYRLVLDYGGEADVGVERLMEKLNEKKSFVAATMRMVGNLPRRRAPFALFECVNDYIPPRTTTLIENGRGEETVEPGRVRTWRIIGVERNWADRHDRSVELSA